MWRLFPIVFALVLAGCASSYRGAGVARTVECAPYARELTGLQLYGDAADWWDEAAGRYERSASPHPGAALVFRRSGRLPYGHVAVVHEQLSAREITVDQANWVHGRVTRAEPVIDVSDANDWSRVRVWWDKVGAMGATPYATYGFIAP